MTESTLSVSPTVLNTLTQGLEQNADKLPMGAANYIWHNRSFEGVTLTTDENDQEFTLLALGGGNFLVISGDNEQGWYVNNDIAESSDVFPRLEYCGIDEDTDISNEYVFDKDGVLGGETAVAQYEPNPVQRRDHPVEITHLTLTNGVGVPFEWQGLTADDEPFYLRERSGTIKARVGGDYGIDGDTIYHAFIGGEFPGTPISKEEVISTVDAVDYITINVDLPEVPDERLEEMFERYSDSNSDVFADFDNIDYEDDDLFQD